MERTRAVTHVVHGSPPRAVAGRANTPESGRDRLDLVSSGSDLVCDSRFRFAALHRSVPAHDLLHGLRGGSGSLGDRSEGRPLFARTQNGYHVVRVDFRSLTSDLSDNTD